jgi:hypothetical protein
MVTNCLFLVDDNNISLQCLLVFTCVNVSNIVIWEVQRSRNFCNIKWIK